MERKLGGGEEKVLELIKKKKNVSTSLKYSHYIRELYVMMTMKMMRMRMKITMVTMIIKMTMMTLSGPYQILSS